MTCALEYEKISKEYRSWSGRRRIRALQDFSLSVNEGEIFGFLGPNGAGKTTAIHLALGFMRATSGIGWMLGKPFGDVAPRRRVGFLAENVVFCQRSAVESLCKGIIVRRGAKSAVPPELRCRSLIAGRTGP